jgi:hypothetical protein
MISAGAVTDNRFSTGFQNKIGNRLRDHGMSGGHFFRFPAHEKIHLQENFVAGFHKMRNPSEQINRFPDGSLYPVEVIIIALDYGYMCHISLSELVILSGEKIDNPAC